MPSGTLSEILETMALAGVMDGEANYSTASLAGAPVMRVTPMRTSTHPFDTQRPEEFEAYQARDNELTKNTVASIQAATAGGTWHKKEKRTYLPSCKLLDSFGNYIPLKASEGKSLSGVPLPRHRDGELPPVEAALRKNKLADSTAAEMLSANKDNDRASGEKAFQEGWRGEEPPLNSENHLW